MSQRAVPGQTLAQLAAALLLCLLPGQLWSQSGYRLDRAQQQIVTESSQHWEAWHWPFETMTMSAEGVRPRRWRLKTNVVVDIVDFLREAPPGYLSEKKPAEIELLDAISAGSNREGVLNVLDGDPSTFWEPDPPPDGADLATFWWFTIDLGRLVVADRIVVNFVAEELGDPFYVFDVYTSDSQKPVSAVGGQTLEFLPVLQMLEPNTTRRHFEIDFSGASKQTRERVVRFLQVVARGSRLDRGVEIDPDEHERLLRESPQDAGAVEYMKLRRDGRELAVSKENYDRLDDDRRGPTRYYRRERPRLADIEIWEEGEDFARHLMDRGGSITSAPAIPNSPLAMFDGNIATPFPANWDIIDSSVRRPEVVVDLGSHFWLKTFRILQALRGGFISFSLGNHQFDYSDGSKSIDGSIDWVTVRQVSQKPFSKLPIENNPDNILVSPTHIHVERHPVDMPVKARFLRIAYDKTPRFMLAAVYPLTELQAFGEGYQPEVTIESRLMDPLGTRTLTSIEWDADVPPGTQLLLQTRTSQTKTEETRYFNRLAEEVDSLFYAKNLFDWKEDTAIPDGNLRGDIVTEELVGNDASEWSLPYRTSGERVTSPSPRNFVQIRATLLSDVADTAAAIRAIRLNYSEPLADAFLGEVTPTRVESLAVLRPFSLYIRPEFSTANTGFDGLVLTAPDGMKLGRTAALYAGVESDLVNRTDLDELEIAAQRIPTGDDSLLVTFPAIGPGDDVQLLRLDFEGQLFSVGGVVRAFTRLRESEDDDVIWQQVDEGDAAAEIDGNSLIVVGLQSDRRLFLRFDLPAVFSPNGDGVNDVAELGFSVVLVGRSRAVEVGVYDLSGRLVRRLDEQRLVSAGSYSIEWDGRSDVGELVPPGLYALRFHVAADDEGANLDQRDIIRSIAVVY